jgi:hypothetical protein
VNLFIINFAIACGGLSPGVSFAVAERLSLAHEMNPARFGRIQSLSLSISKIKKRYAFLLYSSEV